MMFSTLQHKLTLEEKNFMQGKVTAKHAQKHQL